MNLIQIDDSDWLVLDSEKQKEKCGVIDYIETQVLENDEHCYSLLLSQFWCTENYFLLQNRDLKFCQKTTFSTTRP